MNGILSGTQTGDLALWEGEALKVYKVIPIPAHKEFFDDNSGRIKEGILRNYYPITINNLAVARIRNSYNCDGS